MTKRLILFLIFIVPLWAACRQETVVTTPTPFDAQSTAVSLLASGTPAPTSLLELRESPEMFEGQYIQVTGQFEPRPLLVCNTEAHHGPAAWNLRVSEEIQIPVGGFDTQVRSLIPKETAMTVNGYWRYWEGPVGCGKQAVGRQMWYLKVTELVSPEFLARKNEGPTQGATIEPAPTEVPADGTAFPPAGAGATAVSTPSPTATMSLATPQPGVPTNTPTSTAAGLGQPTVTASPTTQTASQTNTPLPSVTQTPQPTGGSSPTPSRTPTSTVSSTNTPIPTPTGSSNTPTPISGGNFIITDLGETLNPDDGVYGFESLGTFEKQNWTLELDTSDEVKISVVGAANMNLTLVVFDEIDNELINQNNAPAGQIEEITNLMVNPNETYIIQVYEVNGLAGDYFLTIEGNDSPLLLSSRGVLTYGETQSDMLPEGDYHFWYFNGEAGDVIDIITAADNNQLLLITLLDSQNDIVRDEFGDFIEYIEEEVTDLTLPATGLYLIWLEEFAYETTNYSITLNGP